MKHGKVNFVVDAFWGSSGKGKLSAWLADKNNVRYASAANYPNAGHTVVRNGKKYMFKVLPSAAAIPGVTSFLTPGAGFSVDRLREEMLMVDERNHTYVHSRAVVVTDLDKSNESWSTKGIASTMQGSGAAMARKLMRPVNESAIVRDYGFVERDTLTQVLAPEAFRATLRGALERNMLLHEVSQGYALSIDHGTAYPYCTSRNCTPQAALDYLGLPFSTVGDVYLNIRPYPIRVGNVVEDGKMMGFSGPFPHDCTEITWDEVARDSGMPEEEAKLLAERERTTVTKRIRRVATLSPSTLRDAARTCGATLLALNFAQYIDWKAYKLRGYGEGLLPDKVKEFVHKIEDICGVPCVYVGTGEDHEDVVTLA